VTNLQGAEDGHDDEDDEAVVRRMPNRRLRVAGVPGALVGWGSDDAGSRTI
jgi:hypothetical protein